MPAVHERPARHSGRLARGSVPDPATFGRDVLASLVVFLVAVPLCIGVAVASGVPPALGIISGIVGGLVVGFLPGSSLQVSGPAAGLAALVLEAVTDHGLELLGPIVLASGVIQIVLGLAKMGRLFQAISVSVVQGMLAGIGLPLILSQTYALMDARQQGSALKNLAGLPELLSSLASPRTATAFALGAGSVAICFLWKKVPGPAGKVPAPLVAVFLGSLAAALPGVDVKRVVVGDLVGAVNVPSPGALAGLADPEVLTVVVTFAIIASAESLFSAAAADRMHNGPRTQYNPELVSQGVGNAVAGMLGAMPITAVIARTSANVQAGAKTKLSRILHGGWLLAFGLVLPGLLGLIPVSVLAGILIQAGWKLLDPAAFPRIWRADRGEGLVMIITTVAIIVANLLEGVLAGMAVAVVLAALRMSRITIRKTAGLATDPPGTVRLVIRGNGTFLQLPRLIDALSSVGDAPRVHVDLTGMSHLDHACRSQVEQWAEQRRQSGAEHVVVLLPDAAHQTAPITLSEFQNQQADADVRVAGEPAAARPAAAPAAPARQGWGPLAMTGMAVACTAVATMIGVAAAGVILNRTSSPPAAAAPPTGPAPRDPAAPSPSASAMVASRVSAAAARARTASFSLRRTACCAASITADGEFTVTPGDRHSFTMTVAGASGPLRTPARVVLEGHGGRVRVGESWRPVANVGLQSSGYAALSARVRWMASIPNVTALLQNSTTLTGDGRTWRGVASLARLAALRDQGPLYANLAHVGAADQVPFTVELGADSLPRRVRIEVNVQGRRQVWTTTYADWGRRA